MIAKVNAKIFQDRDTSILSRWTGRISMQMTVSTFSELGFLIDLLSRVELVCLLTFRGNRQPPGGFQVVNDRKFMPTITDMRRSYLWGIAANLSVIAILAREYGGLFDGGGIRFWINIVVHAVLLGCIPIGFLACSSLLRERGYWSDARWWFRVGISKIVLAIYFLLFLYSVFFSSHRA